MKITIREAADVLEVHPRTIVRALAGKENVHWPEETAVNHTEVATAFDFPPVYLVRAFGDGDADKLLNAQQAADFLGLKLATFRYRKPPKLIVCGGVVRYSRQELVNWDLS